MRIVARDDPTSNTLSDSVERGNICHSALSGEREHMWKRLRVAVHLGYSRTSDQENSIRTIRTYW